MLSLFWEMQVRDLLRQIDQTADAGLFYVALYAALSVPDVCAALSAEDGKACGPRYKAWCDTWLAPRYNGNLSGETCWHYRCGVLHQHRADHPRLAFERVIFVEPRAGHAFFHNNVMNGALNIDIGRFVHDVTEVALAWWDASALEANVARNWANTMKLHENGIAPYIVGMAVIG